MARKHGQEVMGEENSIIRNHLATDLSVRVDLLTLSHSKDLNLSVDIGRIDFYSFLQKGGRLKNCWRNVKRAKE